MSEQYDLNNPVPYKIWGKEHIEPGAIQQMERAVRLPIAVRGALMPDAHLGYGLPIGGVLATDNVVIPYAVGVDIACRVRMTIYNVPSNMIERSREKLRTAIERNTCFGVGQHYDKRRDHEVMDDPAWDNIAFARQNKDLAWEQLGTSGGGNHFADFGVLKITKPVGKIPAGSYLALLTHSGSRRFGMNIANRYTDIAMQKHAGRLPKDYIHLSWLELGKDGDEYWAMMELAGRYASANHAIIHRQVTDAIRFEVLGSVENHHNFAWKEIVDGKERIVHRKGATPASLNTLGVIPGSMSAPGFIVQGKGSTEGINSAAHGAGRMMSRAQAKRTFTWEQAGYKLKKANVDLISAGLDEVPFAYKDIHAVMAAQGDLVETLAEFQPRIVKMAPEKKGFDRKRRKKKGRRRKK